MYNTVKSCYLKGKIDEKKGLTKAVKLGWITEEQKQELIKLKWSIDHQHDQPKKKEPLK